MRGSRTSSPLQRYEVALRVLSGLRQQRDATLRDSAARRSPRVQDPILGITENFLADNTPEKMNLGVVRPASNYR
jgi:hypothetical protein